MNRRLARVAIDLHMVGTRETGNETYALQLALALERAGGFQYLFYSPYPATVRRHLGSGASVRTYPSVPAALRLLWFYPRMVKKDGASLLHVTYVAPPRLKCPSVVTVHDLSFRRFPAFFSPRVRLILNLLVPFSVRSASRVLAPSESCRQDIVNFYGVPPDRVIVTPEAASPQYRPQAADAVQRVCTAYGIASPYILAVGNLQPRKNLLRLIEAFSAVARDMPDINLVLVGRSTWRGSGVKTMVSTAGLAERVRVLGYVPDADLPALYSGAITFCYPSLWEGFGLPPLEAMACGTPTVTSNVSSLPEVVGEAAIMVDPTSVGDIATALRVFLSSEQARREYRARGLVRARRFSWERTAQLTRDAYEAVLAPPHKATS